MRIETLSVDNLRDGVFCARGQRHGEEMYQRLEAWLRGDILRGRVAREDSGEAVGFIIYYPIEHAPLDVTGEGLYVVQCVHVKEPYQLQGIGRALVESALTDAQDEGASGLAVEGFRQQKPGAFDYLPGSFFEHIGLSPSESRGPATLFYMSFDEEAQPPRYMQPRYPQDQGRFRVRIDLFDCRSCYRQMDNRDLVEAVAESVGPDRVDVQIHDQTSRDAIVDKGMSSGMFVDGRLTYFQGPVTEADVLNAINVAESARERSIDH